ncbi:MAG: disulfide bond formation protein B [Pseudomonadota bacterium]|nr:disulfide bond formation protein B [Pseudomonadota bacterium]
MARTRTGTLSNVSALIALGAFAAIAAALAFEHVGGYRPCPLCLMERYAYYFGVPAALAAMFLARQGSANAARLVLALAALGFLMNAGLGVYHAGAEWKWWPGPDTCGNAAGLAGKVTDLLNKLNETRVIRCDEAPWRQFGLSFAGWSAVISAALGLLGLAAAWTARR